MRAGGEIEMAIVATERLDDAGVPAVDVDERAPRLNVDLQTADGAWMSSPLGGVRGRAGGNVSAKPSCPHHA